MDVWLTGDRFSGRNVSMRHVRGLLSVVLAISIQPVLAQWQPGSGGAEGTAEEIGPGDGLSGFKLPLADPIRHSPGGQPESPDAAGSSLEPMVPAGESAEPAKAESVPAASRSQSAPALLEKQPTVSDTAQKSGAEATSVAKPEPKQPEPPTIAKPEPKQPEATSVAKPEPKPDAAAEKAAKQPAEDSSKRQSGSPETAKQETKQPEPAKETSIEKASDSHKKGKPGEAESKRSTKPKSERDEALQRDAIKYGYESPPTAESVEIGGDGPAKPPGEVMGVLWSKYQRIGQKAAEFGDAALAEKSVKEALAEAEQLGDKDPRLALTLDGLAQLYLRQRRYPDAEQLAKRLLARREQVAGPESQEVAASLVFLASLYQLQGRPLEAEPPVQKAIAIVEKLPGGGQDLAHTLSLLASIRYDQGKIAEAEELYKKVLALHERLGVSDAALGSDLEDYAGLVWKSGRPAAAEPLLIRALSIREKAQGVAHPETVGCMRSLCSLYLSLGQYRDAEPVCRKAIEASRSLQGISQVDLATDMNNMAVLYYAQGKLEQAEQMFKIALEIRERVLGADHELVAQSLAGLARVFRDRGKASESLPLFKRAIAIDMKSGQDTLILAHDQEDYGLALCKANANGEAEEALKHALSIREKLQGADHVELLSAFRGLTSVYRWQKRFTEAKVTADRLLALVDRNGAGSDSRLLADLDLVASAYEADGKLGEAKTILIRALPLAEKQKGAADRSMAPRLLKLALLSEAKADESVAYYQWAISVLEKAKGTNTTDVANALDEYAKSLRKWQKADEADKVAARAKTIRLKNRTAAK